MYCKDIVVRTMMLQSYLVTENNSSAFHLSNKDVFDCFVIMLHDAIYEKPYYGYRYPVINVIKVG